MMPWEIAITVDELVLDGFPPGDYGRIGEALSGELGRLVAERGVPAELLEGGGAARMPSPMVTLNPGESVERIGARVAQAIYRGWASPGHSAREPGSGGGEQR